jgi:hypothetical protein
MQAPSDKRSPSLGGGRGSPYRFSSEDDWGPEEEEEYRKEVDQQHNINKRQS